MAVPNFLKAIGLGPKVSFIDYSEAEQVLTAQAYLVSHQWELLESYLIALEHNERCHVISVLTEVKGRPPEFDLWGQQRPESVMAYIFSGMHLINWAWEARGGGTADTVSEDDVDKFYERLLLAKATLESAIELDNSYPDSYVGLITIAMGTGYDRDQVWDYFAKALVHCKSHYQVHSAMIHALAEKWGGEAGEMFVIASKAVVSIEDGNPLAGIVAEAHIEQWLYLGMCDMTAEAEIYFREQKVRDELKDAYEKVRHCSIDTTQHIEAFNNFAFCFYMSGLNSLAKEAMIKLDGQFIEHPWDYLEEPFLAYLDTGFAVDHVLDKLSVVDGNLPDIVRANKPVDEDSPESNEAVTYVADISDHTDRRVFKTPFIVPLSSIAVILIFGGYSYYHLYNTVSGTQLGISSIVFEVFLLCEVGMMSLILYNKKIAKDFLARYPVIQCQNGLEYLKPFVRTNMYSTLLLMLFLALGATTAVMTMINLGWMKGTVVGFLSVTAAGVMNSYNVLEQKIKQIECTDSEVESELRDILDCWLHKAFPNF